MANFADSVQVILKHEGGYAFNPADPGGETKYGISKAQFPDLNIPALTINDAMDIYERTYWDKFRLGEVKNQKIATAVFDAVVQHGQGIRIVQQALTASGSPVKIDNIIGPETLGALNKVHEITFLKNYVTARKSYMDSLIVAKPALAQFRKTWYKRVDFFFPTNIVSRILPALIAGGFLMWFLFHKK